MQRELMVTVKLFGYKLKVFLVLGWVIVSFNLGWAESAFNEQWLVCETDVQAVALAHQAGWVKVHQYRHFPWALYEAPSSSAHLMDARLMQSIAQSPAIEADSKVTLQSTPNDPAYSRQWAFQPSLSGFEDANPFVYKAWDLATQSQSLVIAIIDSGIDPTHEDLKNNMWVNEKEFAGKAGTDDDKNGYTDDIYGWNFVSNNTSIADELPHGVMVSGVTAASGNNGIGVAGVCWSARMMTLKCFARNNEKSGTLSVIIKAIDYALDWPEVRIINASWTTPTNSSALFDAIAAANRQGVLLVAAAGNWGVKDGVLSADLAKVPYYPACYNLANVVCVASINSNGKISDFSNYGSPVDIVAPGKSIYTTAMDNKYVSSDGTSFAAPLVSGVLALLLELDPSLSVQQVRTRLANEGARWTSSVTSSKVGGGVLNAFGLLSGPNAANGWMLYP